MVLSLPDSRRPEMAEMSRVRDAKMLICRVLGRMSEMVRLEASPPSPVFWSLGLSVEGGWPGPGFMGF